jgi:hypothetical protein
MPPRKQIYKITYPNGKIWVGMDLIGMLLNVGSPSARDRIAADLDAQRLDLTLRKEILWESETATDEAGEGQDGLRQRGVCDALAVRVAETCLSGQDLHGRSTVARLPRAFTDRPARPTRRRDQRRHRRRGPATDHCQASQCAAGLGHHRLRREAYNNHKRPVQLDDLSVRQPTDEVAEVGATSRRATPSAHPVAGVRAVVARAAVAGAGAPAMAR